MSITRRNVCKAGIAAASLAGVAGVAAGSSIAIAQGAAGQTEFPVADPKQIFQAEIDASFVVTDTITEFETEEEYDVVVVGAGTSGLPAALAAFQAGASVAVLQKTDAPVAQGMLAARVSKAESSEVGIAEYIHEMHCLNDHRPDLSLLKKYAEASDEAVSWYIAQLESIGFEGMNEQDSLLHTYDDGDCQIRGQFFTGGMINPTKALAQKAEDDGVVFYYDTPAVQLVVENGAVKGVIGENEDGGYVKLLARKGVILATGDYQNNAPMLARYCCDACYYNPMQAGKTGDGHLMGMLAGAVMEPGTHAKMIHRSGNFRNEPFLAVNLKGERFMYEDVPYGERNTILRDQPGHAMYSIFDDDYTNQVYGWGSDPTVPTVANGKPEQIASAVEKGQILSADTFEGLAEAAGLPIETFVATVERYNELCALHADLDFGKASKYMQPLATPPYYAIKRAYMIAAIPAGLVIDANGQCKNADGELISGLFAAGNCSGPFYSDTDYSLETMGLSVGRCITFGYVTGSYVASL